MSVPTYAYALNNPIKFVDRNGLDPGVPYADLATAAADAKSYLYRTHSPDAFIHEWGTTFYRRPDGRVQYSEPETQGLTNRCETGAFRKPPPGLTPIGELHNHPRHSPNSWEDKGFSRVKLDWWGGSSWDNLYAFDDHRRHA